MQVLCGQCRELLTVDDAQAGKQVRCPHCEHVIIVPGSSEAPKPAPAGGEEDFGFAEQARAMGDMKVHVTCAACHSQLAVSTRQSGRVIACPACREGVRVPFPGEEDQDPLERLAQERDQDDDGALNISEIDLAPPLPPSTRLETASASAQASGLTSDPEPDEASDDSPPASHDPAAQPATKSDESLKVIAEAVAQKQAEPPPPPKKPMSVEPGQLAEALDSLSQAGQAATPPSPARDAAVKPTTPRRRPANRQTAAKPTSKATPKPATATHPARSATQKAAPRTASAKAAKASSNVNLLLGGLLAAGILIAVGIFVVIPKLLGPDDKGVNSVTDSPGGTTQNPSAHTPSPTPHVDPSPQPLTPEPDKGQPTPPRVMSTFLEIERVDTSPFAANGRMPAPLGMAYLQVTLSVRAGREVLRLATAGPDVTLDAADGPYESLGATVRAMGPAQPRTKPIAIPAEQSRQVELLFLVSEDVRQGRLRIEGLADLGFESVTGQVPPPPDHAWRGNFRESPPRNLKPLLSDPVMAQLQIAHGHTLRFHPRRDRLDVHLHAPGVEVIKAEPIDPGLLRLTLRNGQDELACTLRALGDGQTLVLYLSEKPFHQLTYRRRK